MNDEQLIERVTTLYERTFCDCDEGRAFLGSKGITSAELYSRHHIGYCDGSLRKILPSTGNVLTELTKLGILLEDPSASSGQAAQVDSAGSPQERFLGCLTFPLTNVDGKIASIMGLNLKSGDYVFLPTRGISAWNIGIIKACSEVYVAKTILDALSLEVAGCPNVIAVSGRGLTEKDKRLLNEYGVHALPVHERANECLLKEGAKKLAERIASPKPAAETAEKPQVADKPQTVSSGQGFTVTYGVRRYEVQGLEKKAKSLRATIRVEHAGKLHIDTQDLYSSKAGGCCHRSFAAYLMRYRKRLSPTSRGSSSNARIMSRREARQMFPPCRNGRKKRPRRSQRNRTLSNRYRLIFKPAGLWQKRRTGCCAIWP